MRLHIPNNTAPYVRPRGYVGITTHLAWTVWAAMFLTAIFLGAQLVAGAVRVPVVDNITGILRPAADPFVITLPPENLVSELSAAPGQKVMAGSVLAKVHVERAAAAVEAVTGEIRARQYFLNCLNGFRSKPFSDPLNKTLAGAYTEAERQCRTMHIRVEAEVADLKQDRKLLENRRVLVVQTLKLLLASGQADLRKQAQNALLLRSELKSLETQIAEIDGRILSVSRSILGQTGAAAQKALSEIAHLRKWRDQLQKWRDNSEVFATQDLRVSRIRRARNSDFPEEQTLGIEAFPLSAAHFTAELYVPNPQISAFSPSTRLSVTLAGVNGAAQSLTGRVRNREPLDGGDKTIVRIDLDPAAQAFLSDPLNGLAFRDTSTAISVTLERQPQTLGRLLNAAWGRDF
ncbi:MAG: hypothetical protein HRU30_13745 [Rhodobacteraceae bacterium]|nr:hypothetical protein [Paracoccaceae bacterium]